MRGREERETRRGKRGRDRQTKKLTTIKERPEAVLVQHKKYTQTRQKYI